MENNPHGFDDLHDEENRFFSSDDEDNPAMYEALPMSGVSTPCASCTG
jgi:hypothetical protein